MRAVGSLVLLAVACVAAAPAAGAGEARARGRKAIIRWTEADGSVGEADARQIVYGYWERLLLSVEKKGKTYKDKELTVKGLPVAENFIHFRRIETIGFGWSEGNGGESILTLTVKLWDKSTVTATGHEMAGASHPVSPYIAFTAGGVARSFDLNPVGPDRRSGARLLEIAFYP